MDEASAFLDALERTPADAPTACAGWTAHELVAHLAAGAAEMADLTEAACAERPARATKAFADREAPYVALDDPQLRERLVVEALRLDAAVAALGVSQTVAFAGRALRADDLRMHGRSEAALHRWDLVGDDDVSAELLAQPELTAHAVVVLNEMVAGSAESVVARAQRAAIVPGTEFAFASPGEPDVVLVCDGTGARLALRPASSNADATADAATRLLALWGRRSAGSVRWTDDAARASCFAAFLGV